MRPPVRRTVRRVLRLAGINSSLKFFSVFLPLIFTFVNISPPPLSLFLVLIFFYWTKLLLVLSSLSSYIFWLKMARWRCTRSSQHGKTSITIIIYHNSRQQCAGKITQLTAPTTTFCEEAKAQKQWQKRTNATYTHSHLWDELLKRLREGRPYEGESKGVGQRIRGCMYAWARERETKGGKTTKEDLMIYILAPAKWIKFVWCRYYTKSAYLRL